MNIIRTPSNSIKDISAETVYMDLFQVYGETENGMHFYWSNGADRTFYIIDTDYALLQGDGDVFATFFVNGDGLLKEHEVGKIKEGNPLHDDIIWHLAMACHKKYRTLPDFEDYYDEFVRKD